MPFCYSPVHLALCSFHYPTTLSPALPPLTQSSFPQSAIHPSPIGRPPSPIRPSIHPHLSTIHLSSIHPPPAHPPVFYPSVHHPSARPSTIHPSICPSSIHHPPSKHHPIWPMCITCPGFSLRAELPGDVAAPQCAHHDPGPRPSRFTLENRAPSCSGGSCHPEATAAPTCAHDEAWGVVLGVHSARHVGVVCPAQVQVQVAVRLQGGERDPQSALGWQSVPQNGRTEAKSTPVASEVGRQG